MNQDGQSGTQASVALDGEALVRVETPEEVAAAVREYARVAAVGGGTKPGLHATGGHVTRLDLSALDEAYAYDPEEFTFTAGAGMRLQDVREMLAERGQYLPFRPPLADAGATLGGVVASGLSGAGRYRYGGVRDFLIGIRFVDGRGQIVRGGGSVVKNAAGFDLPKLMVGSGGRLGVLTEVTFKVFPAPIATASLRVRFHELSAASAAMVRLTRTPLDLDALDLVPGRSEASLWVRLAGLEDALPSRMDRLAEVLRSQRGTASVERFPSHEPPAHWSEMDRLDWAKGMSLIRVSLTPARILDLDRLLEQAGAERRYSAGGNSAWIAWRGTLEALDRMLRQNGLAGTCVFGRSPHPWLGELSGAAFLRRVALALDPDQKFGALADFRG